MEPKTIPVIGTLMNEHTDRINDESVDEVQIDNEVESTDESDESDDDDDEDESSDDEVVE